MAKNIALFIVTCHFGLVLLAMLALARTSDEALALAVVGPAFAGYGAAALSYIASPRRRRTVASAARVGQRGLAMWVAAIGSVGFVAAVILHQAEALQAVEVFARNLGVAEGVNGVYMGCLVKALFSD